MESLKNNRLILNGHRIFTLIQLFGSISKKIKKEIHSESDIENSLKGYNDLNIAIWHSDSFLKDEPKEIHDRIIRLLELCGSVKQTGKNKL